MKLVLYFLITSSFIILCACNSASQEIDEIKTSLVSSTSTIDKINFLIIYSGDNDIDNAKRKVARSIGCTKSSINRVLNSEVIPSPLMQSELNNVYFGALNNKSLKSMDKTLNFWHKYLIFWHTPDTTDIYTATVNPLFEEIP